MSQTVVLRVSMSCSGCSGAVQRALGKAEGVESFEVDLKEQKVTVKTNLPPEAIFETVSKTGKKTSYWEEPQPQAPAPAHETDPAPETAAAETAPAPPPETAPAAALAETDPAPAETDPAPAETAPVEPVSSA